MKQNALNNGTLNATLTSFDDITLVGVDPYSGADDSNDATNDATALEASTDEDIDEDELAASAMAATYGDPSGHHYSMSFGWEAGYDY